MVFHKTRAGPPRDIAGLALRTWRPFEQYNPNQVPNTIMVKEVRLYHTTGTTAGLAWPAPSYGVTCAQDVAIEVFPPHWSAQRWDTWTIRIPFTTKFSYNGTDSLGIWLHIERPDNLWLCEVDAVNDATAPYSMSEGAQAPQAGSRPCTGPGSCCRTGSG